MQQPARKYYTPTEYLAREKIADYRSEYYQGEIFAMAGGSANHNRIAGNFFASLRQQTAGGACQAFMAEMKVWIEPAQLFAYPDVIVVFGEPRFHSGSEDAITNPLMIAEVLSESTKNYDRGEKFKFYRMAATLREYVLIDQFSIHVEQFAREQDSGKWVLTEYLGADAVLKLSSLSFEMALSELYERVKF
jgi:Uma2 family endonuclease